MEGDAPTKQFIVNWRNGGDVSAERARGTGTDLYCECCLSYASVAEDSDPPLVHLEWPRELRWGGRG